MNRFTRPVFWAGLVMIPLLFITVYAYYFWHQLLVDRGAGYVLNTGKYDRAFLEARLLLLVGLVIGFVTYELTRRLLARGWRVGYVIVLAMGIALFVVEWVVVRFGPTPYLHLPWNKLSPTLQFCHRTAASRSVFGCRIRYRHHGFSGGSR